MRGRRMPESRDVIALALLSFAGVSATAGLAWGILATTPWEEACYPLDLKVFYGDPASSPVP